MAAVDFVVGFEDEEVNENEVKATILEILKEIKNATALSPDIEVGYRLKTLAPQGRGE